MQDTLSTPPTAEDLSRIDQALEDGGANGITRRQVLGRMAAGIVAASGTANLLGAATAGAATTALPQQVASLIATNEAFGVTFLTEAIRRAPGTPSERFTGVLRAANTAEFDHIRGLREIGGRPVTERFWIPDALFGGNGAGLFASIEALEVVEISGYLAGITAFGNEGNGRGARIIAEAMGVECEHRVLARNAQNLLGSPQGVPNNKSFETYQYRSVSDVQRAVARLGIGVGRRGTKPGRFYTFPGDPRENNAGSNILQQHARTS